MRRKNMANCVKSVLDNDYGNLDDILIMDEKTLFEIDSDRRFGYNWISEHSVFIHDRVFVGDEDSRAIICAVRVLAVLGDYKIRIISNIFSRSSNISIVFNNNEILNILPTFYLNSLKHSLLPSTCTIFLPQLFYQI